VTFDVVQNFWASAFEVRTELVDLKDHADWVAMVPQLLAAMFARLGIIGLRRALRELAKLMNNLDQSRPP
jgi:uncharacterized membrane protein